jgi:hypothetical protein
VGQAEQRALGGSSPGARGRDGLGAEAARVGAGERAQVRQAAARPERRREEARGAGPGQARGNGRLAVPSGSGAWTHRGTGEPRSGALAAGAR